MKPAGASRRSIRVRHSEWRARARARWLARVDLRQLATWSALSVSALLLLVVFALSWPVLRRFVLLGAASVVFTYLVAPVVELVRRSIRYRGVPLARAFAVLLVYAVLAVLGTLTWRLLFASYERQLSNVVATTRGALEVTLQRLQVLDSFSAAVPVPHGARTLAASAAETISNALRQETEATLRELSEHAPYARWLWLVPIVAFVLLTAWPAFRRSATRILPDGHVRWRGDEFLAQVNAALAGYTRAQLLACATVGTLCAAGFAILRVPSPVGLGLLAGALEFFPVVGPLATLLISASLVSGARLILVLAFLAALRLVQDYVIYPRLIGRRMHLSAVAVIAAVLVGAELGGLIGVFCAIPTVGVLSVALRQYREYREVERLVREHGRGAAITEVAPLVPPASDGPGPPHDASRDAGATVPDDVAPA